MNHPKKDIEQLCQPREVANTWKMASEISERSNDESGPGKNDYLVSVSSYPRHKQILCFMAKYLTERMEEGLPTKTSQDVSQCLVLKAPPVEGRPCESQGVLS